jgi:hypothetical protein
LELWFYKDAVPAALGGLGQLNKFETGKKTEASPSKI